MLEHMNTNKFHKKVKGLTHNDSGATAIEFALVGVPFFLVLFAIFELGIISLSSKMLDIAVDKTARLIRTGNMNNATKAEFNRTLCNNIPALIRCTDVKFDLYILQNFHQATNPPRKNPASNLGIIESEYSASKQKDIVLMRVSYVYKTIMPHLFTSSSRGRVVLRSNTIFRNEPFS